MSTPESARQGGSDDARRERGAAFLRSVGYAVDASGDSSQARRLPPGGITDPRWRDQRARPQERTDVWERTASGGWRTLGTLGDDAVTSATRWEATNQASGWEATNNRDGWWVTNHGGGWGETNQSAGWLVSNHAPSWATIHNHVHANFSANSSARTDHRSYARQSVHYGKFIMQLIHRMIMRFMLWHPWITALVIVPFLITFAMGAAAALVIGCAVLSPILVPLYFILERNRKRK